MGDSNFFCRFGKLLLRTLKIDLQNTRYSIDRAPRLGDEVVVNTLYLVEREISHA